MKKLLYVTILTTMYGVCSNATETTPLNENASSTRRDLSDNYVQRFGAGIIIGEPSGASLKYWFNDTLAIDGAVGWSSHDNTDLYVHSDALWHNFDLIPVSQGRLPLYFGVGGLMRIRDDNEDNQFGIRVPVGLSYMFENSPIDVFVEIAPAIDVSPKVQGEVTGGIGIRYWF